VVRENNSQNQKVPTVKFTESERQITVKWITEKLN